MPATARSKRRTAGRWWRRRIDLPPPPGDYLGPEAGSDGVARVGVRFTNRLDRDAVEVGEIVGFAAGHQLPVAHHGLVHPVCARVPEIGFQRRPRRHAPAVDATRVDQRPGTMADGGDRLARGDEILDELKLY